ncbi:MAG: GntR family transcriptional regulator [Tepidanaerobacteraceae bacterium]|nr:GntR family transcriptional regulator [Tepidanaerobacteraceae bacterium]
MQMAEYKELKSKKDYAYEKIKDDILNNVIKPGSVLNERELCESLNISRTPVREAILKLASDGLVEILPNRGAFVTNITYEVITEIYDIREVLEGLAVKLFCICATEEEIDELKRVLDLQERMKQNNDLEKFVEYDKTFHHLILKGCKNKNLKNIMENIRTKIERITNLTVKDIARAETTLTHHKEIFKEISQRNYVEAEKLMKHHISESKEYHIKNLKYLLGKL